MSTLTIGISGSRTGSGSVEAMISRVEEEGFNALLIDDHAKRDPAKDVADMHGLIVMGSDFDIDPKHYIARYPKDDPRHVVHPKTINESNSPEQCARAEYEFEAIKTALKNKTPLLGICCGMQRINVVCGGTLHQHVPDLVGHERLYQNQHGIDPCTPTHPILIESGTKLSAIARDIEMPFVKGCQSENAKVIMENTLRHQSIDMVGEGLIVSGKSDAIRMKDGSAQYLIESIEASPDGPYKDQFLIGVQWHPEFGASTIGKYIIRHLLNASQNFNK
ncbi:MAG: gamma-glutamyl-gamma-aminobutyrate hydrolase family protein [Rickettsiales bacterium]